VFDDLAEENRVIIFPQEKNALENGKAFPLPGEMCRCYVEKTATATSALIITPQCLDATVTVGKLVKDK
jgi:hypothetical protein